MRNVITEVVSNDICCGCGLCAALCPFNAIEMSYDWEKGELIPVLVGQCESTCQLCIEVCPSLNHTQNLDYYAKALFANTKGMKYHSYVGYYLSSYVGYSKAKDERKHGASGGMATWFLEMLLSKKIIDGVITIVNESSKEKNQLFRYAILRDIDSVIGASGSKYYPVEMSEVIREVLSEKEDNQYAIVVLPCRAYGLRRAMLKMPRLRKKIKYIIGLSCGQLPNRFFTEYCAAISGISFQELGNVNYRSKEGSKRAGNFSFVPSTYSGIKGKPIFNHPLQYRLLSNCYFTHRACLFCDDVFAEVADVVFMDAWLPEYEPDPKGHSLIVIRDSQLDQLFLEGIRQGTCYLKNIPIDCVIKSQKGVIYKKRSLILGRLWYAWLKGYQIPTRRFKASKELYRKNKYIINLQDSVMKNSKLAWSQCRKNSDIKRFQKMMMPYRRKIVLQLYIDRLKRISKDPVGIIRRRLIKAFNK